MDLTVAIQTNNCKAIILFYEFMEPCPRHTRITEYSVNIEPNILTVKAFH